MLAHGQIEEECTCSEETASRGGGHPIETALLTESQGYILVGQIRHPCGSCSDHREKIRETATPTIARYSGYFLNKRLKSVLRYFVFSIQSSPLLSHNNMHGKHYKHNATYATTNKTISSFIFSMLFGYDNISAIL